MLNFLFSLSIATMLGLLAGMGVGGGSLLLLWLTQVIGFSQTQARLTNLLFYLPAATICTWLRSRQRKIPKKIALPAIIAGCTAAVIFSLVSKIVDVAAFKKLLGVLLLYIGIREVLYRPRNAK